MASFIKFNKIAKKVNSKNLLANLSFGVQKGEVLFILGKSGSGRSTLFKILMGIVEKNKGDIFIDGINYDKRKDELINRISYLPQENIFDQQVSILDNLYFYGQLKGMELSFVKKECIRLANILGFKKYLNMFPNQVPFECLRKISIARCFLSDSEIFLLDNPTVSMNFVDKKIFWKMINECKKYKSILCISQDFEEVQFYADRVIIINNGSVAINSSIININNVINDNYRYQFIFKKIVSHNFLKQMKKNSDIKDIICRDKYFEFSTKNKSVFFKAFQIAIDYNLIDLKFNYSKINELFLKVTE